jgi:hypothetical protein
VRKDGPLANCGAYPADDVVFVSINGRRRNRIGIEAYEAELSLAAGAGAAFVTDDLRTRENPYNVGEREVAEWLTRHGYREDPPSSGNWRPRLPACGASGGDPG